MREKEEKEGGGSGTREIFKELGVEEGEETRERGIFLGFFLDKEAMMD